MALSRLKSGLEMPFLNPIQPRHVTYEENHESLMDDVVEWRNEPFFIIFTN